MFQKAFTLGLLKEHGQKIQILDQLLANYPKSNYLDDAYFEEGKSYVILQQPEKALEAYQKIITDFPKSSYVAKARVQMGLVYYNQDQNDRALALFKQVVEEYPGSDEARSAMTGLKNIYVDENNVDGYFDYLRSVGETADVSVAEKDSLTYLSGENLYMAGDCDRAVEVLGNYLREFPQGSFSTSAWFYRAECLLKLNRTTDALQAYAEVISRPRNIFTEPALVTAASLSYKNRNYYDGLEYYMILEQVAEVPANQTDAVVGQFRCYYALRNHERLAETGDRLLQMQDLPADLVREIHYKMAKSADEAGNTEQALRHYQAIAGEVSTLYGAEAKYRVAELYFKSGDSDKAESEVFSMIDMNTPHQYWMAKAFLLLGDILIKRGDLFQARYTLQSLIDGYDKRDDGILDEAAEKLQKVLDRERFITPEDTLRNINKF